MDCYAQKLNVNNKLALFTQRLQTIHGQIKEMEKSEASGGAVDQ